MKHVRSGKQKTIWISVCTELHWNLLLTNLQNAFYNESLVSIDGITVAASCSFTNAFRNCTALEHVIFYGIIGNPLDLSWSTLLDKESITSIINALSTTTSGLTVTLSKTAVNNAFGIDVDDEATFPEGSEYYELRNSKSNWTISYV